MDYPWLSMDHPPSNVVATPVIWKYNVSMDYPWGRPGPFYHVNDVSVYLGR